MKMFTSVLETQPNEDAHTNIPKAGAPTQPESYLHAHGVMQTVVLPSTLPTPTNQEEIQSDDDVTIIGAIPTQPDSHLQANAIMQTAVAPSTPATPTRCWGVGSNSRGHQANPEENYSSDTLMLVATIIATITFQAGLNPPGGFTQANNNNSSSKSISSVPAGVSVHGQKLSGFLFFDMIGLFTSLSIILLRICVVPNVMMKRVMIVIMWFAVWTTGLAFSAGVVQIFPELNHKKAHLLFYCWSWVLMVFMLGVYCWFVRFLLHEVGWWGNKFGDEERQQMWPLGCKRIAVVIVTPLLLLLLGYLSFAAFKIWDLSQK